MPNRILKESICTSDSIDHLSIEAERLFYRLIVNCDDYGLLDARLPIIKSKCFPLKSSDITDDQLKSWLSELEAQNMVFFYENSGHEYLKMSSWERHQQIRAKRPKCPLPGDENSHKIALDIIGNQMIANVPVIQSNPIRNPIQSESNPNPVPADDPPKKAPVSPATESFYEQVRDSFIANCPSLPKPNTAAKWTDGRKRAVRDKKLTVEELSEVFKRVEKSDFLAGRKGGKDGPWRGCSLDWILKPANWQKINEGNYDTRSGSPEQPEHQPTFDIDEYERTSVYDTKKQVTS